MKILVHFVSKIPSRSQAKCYCSNVISISGSTHDLTKESHLDSQSCTETLIIAIAEAWNHARCLQEQWNPPKVERLQSLSWHDLRLSIEKRKGNAKRPRCTCVACHTQVHGLLWGDSCRGCAPWGECAHEHTIWITRNPVVCPLMQLVCQAQGWGAESMDALKCFFLFFVTYIYML